MGKPKVYCTFVHLQVAPLVEAVECGCCSKVFFGLRNYSEEAGMCFRFPKHYCEKGPSEGCLLLRAETKLHSVRNTIGVLSTESILSTNTWWDIIYRRCAELDEAARLRLNFCDYQFPSGQNGFSPDKMTLCVLSHPAKPAFRRTKRP